MLFYGTEYGSAAFVERQRSYISCALCIEFFKLFFLYMEENVGDKSCIRLRVYRFVEVDWRNAL